MNAPKPIITKTASEGATARQVLETRGALFFSIILVAMTLLASVMQYLGGNTLQHIAPTALSYGLCCALGFVIWRKKKRGARAAALSWVTAFLLTSFAIYARLNYALTTDWQYAVEGIHISAVSILSLAVLQFLYDRKIYITFFVISVAWWFGFLYLAHLNGVTFHVTGIIDGSPQHGRVVILVQAYFYMALALLAYINYRNIPLIDQFHRLTEAQRGRISEQLDERRAIANEVRRNTESLFALVGAQKREIASFNDRLQGQAAAFEEISSTIEQLTAMAEKIADAAGQQEKGNGEVDYTMREFFEIKEQTRERLSGALKMIDRVSEGTAENTARLGEIEKTIAGIREQSLQMSRTVSSINEIAEQINMLSLNASIEAARAGNYGRGFAVVAAEIGKLAGRTGESVKEIEAALTRSNAVTERSVDTIRDAAASIRTMMEDMRESTKKIDELRDNIFLEEKFLAGIDRQLKANVTLSRDNRTGADEQKVALDASAAAVEQLNAEVASMVEGIASIAGAIDRIHDDALTLVHKTMLSGDDKQISAETGDGYGYRKVGVRKEKNNG